MAKQVFTRAFLSLNAVNESTSVKSVSLPSQIGTQDVTAMGDTARRFLPNGLPSNTLEIEFYQDYAAAQLDSRLWPLYSAQTIFAFEVRPTQDAVSTSNPRYTGNGFITSIAPVSANVGETAMVRVTVQVDGAITRATA